MNAPFTLREQGWRANLGRQPSVLLRHSSSILWPLFWLRPGKQPITDDFPIKGMPDGKKAHLDCYLQHLNDKEKKPQE